MVLVIISDFYVVSILTGPPEADPILVVDADAMLAGPVAFERLEPVAGWQVEFIET
jgi:hypothetical protein